MQIVLLALRYFMLGVAFGPYYRFERSDWIFLCIVGKQNPGQALEGSLRNKCEKISGEAWG